MKLRLSRSGGAAALRFWCDLRTETQTIKGPPGFAREDLFVLLYAYFSAGVSGAVGASEWRHLASISSSGISSVLMTESICSILSQSSAGKRLRTRSMTVCR